MGLFKRFLRSGAVRTPRSKLGMIPTDKNEKIRRRQRGVCFMCGYQLVPISGNKMICTNCGHIDVLF